MSLRESRRGSLKRPRFRLIDCHRRYRSSRRVVGETSFCASRAPLVIQVPASPAINRRSAEGSETAAFADSSSNWKSSSRSLGSHPVSLPNGNFLAEVPPLLSAAQAQWVSNTLRSLNIDNHRGVPESRTVGEISTEYENRAKEPSKITPVSVRFGSPMSNERRGSSLGTPPASA